MALTDLPTEITDGRYVLNVEEVHRNWDGDASVETVLAELTPVDGQGESIRVPLPGETLEPVHEGGCYDVRVEDGEFVTVDHDWERAVRREAADANDGELVLPVQASHSEVGTPLESPSTALLESNKSLMVTGEPGAGKTEAIKLLLPQLQTDEDTPIVVFSYKDDYTEWAQDRDDVVRLSTRDPTHIWNVFEEAADESEFDHIARTLFEDERQRSKSPYFQQAASQLLGAVLKYLSREGRAADVEPDNRELVEFTQRFDDEEVHSLLTTENDDGQPVHPDLHGPAGHITPKAPKQSGGVYSTMQIKVEEVFDAGQFGAPTDGEDTISIREYMESPEGRILVLDFPIAQPTEIGPVFEFFLQRAIRLGIRDADRQSFFVLDEFSRVPHVDAVEPLVATGRARNAQTIIGLQSVSQLVSEYGQSRAESIMSGMLYELHLRSGDERTVEYVRNRLGGKVRTTDYVREDDHDRITRTVNRPDRSSDLQRLADGEGFLITPEGHARVSLPMYSELSRDTQHALAADPVEDRFPARTSRDDEPRRQIHTD